MTDPPKPRWWEFALAWCFEHWWEPLLIAAAVFVCWLLWWRNG